MGANGCYRVRGEHEAVTRDVEAVTRDVDEFARELALRFRDSRWKTERRASRRATLLSFVCCAHGGAEISDNVVEDVLDRSGMLVTVAHRIYDGAHAALCVSPGEMWPLCECPNCRISFPVYADGRDPFEYAERQAVLWMERAQRLRGPR
jgi:citrate lyase beta subunit